MFTSEEGVASDAEFGTPLLRKECATLTDSASGSLPGKFGAWAQVDVDAQEPESDQNNNVAYFEYIVVPPMGVFSLAVGRGTGEVGTTSTAIVTVSSAGSVQFTYREQPQDGSQLRWSRTSLKSLLSVVEGVPVRSSKG